MTCPAITFDFHNTVAHCDDWFQLEVHHLRRADLTISTLRGAAPTLLSLLTSRGQVL